MGHGREENKSGKIRHIVNIKNISKKSIAKVKDPPLENEERYKNGFNDTVNKISDLLMVLFIMYWSSVVYRQKGTSKLYETFLDGKPDDCQYEVSDCQTADTWQEYHSCYC